MKIQPTSTRPSNRPRETKRQLHTETFGKPFVVVKKPPLLRRIAQTLGETEMRFELSTRVPAVVGAYILLHTGNVSLYPETDTSNGPIYVGCARNINGRRSDHLRSLNGARLDASDFKIIYLPTVDLGSASYLEQVMLETYEPLWNQTRLRGFGSRPQGSTWERSQTASPWDFLHPGRSGLAQAPRPVIVDLNRLALEDTENTERQTAE